MKWFFGFIISFLLLSTSCKSSYHITEVSENNYALDSTFVHVDSTIYNLLTPYTAALDSKMNKIIGQSEMDFTIGKPESTLGNLLADAMIEISPKYFKDKPDIAIINFGGIRVSNLPKGVISLGNVYEIMPFDNYVVMLKLDGETLQKAFDLMASKGGWPISGAKYLISDGEAKDVLINNEPIKPHYIYSVVLSDYLASGGDNMSMLIDFEQENNNLLLRDMFIAYFQEKYKYNISFESKLDNRVRNE